MESDDMNITAIDKYSTVQSWKDTINPKPNTWRNYSVALQEYVKFTHMNPDELLQQADDEVSAGIIPRNRTIKKHLIGFRNHLNERGLAPNTRANMMSGVKSFYKSFDHEIPNIGRDEMARPLPQHLDIPDKEDIRQVLKVCGPRNKAIILTGCSSGLAANELLNLTVEQFKKGYDPETEITTLYIRREKSGNDFITFLSPEANQAVWEYLNYRNRTIDVIDRERQAQLDKQRVTDKGYLFIVSAVPDEYLQTHNEELRKIQREGLLRAFRLTSEKASKSTPKGTWNLIRAHNMRKVFNSALKNAGMDSEKVEYMMGHTLDRTRAAYYRADAESLKSVYQTFVPYLTIQKDIDVTSTPEYQEKVALIQELTAAKEYYKAERGELESMRKELDTMKKRQGDFNELMDKLKEHPEILINALTATKQGHK